MENNVKPSNAGQGMGIAALVIGILAVIVSFIPCFGFFAVLFGVLAIIFGAVGLSQAKKGNAPVVMPKAGLILGIVATCFVIIWMIVVVGAFGSAVMSHKDEISNAIDSIKVESEKMKDSLEHLEITNDSIIIEEAEN